MTDLRFKNQIYVYAESGVVYTRVHTCDTIEQAAEWIEQQNKIEYTIDGTPEAWHEQTGECGGSSICSCGDI